MTEKIVTADGTETFFNPEFNEAYHSTKAGAYTESLHKFVNPSKIEELAKNNTEISILDVGFGLGYNVAVAFKKAVSVNPHIKLNIFSIEKDETVLQKIKKLNIPDNLKDFYEKLNSLKKSEIKIGKNIYSTYQLEDKNLSLKIINAEGRKVIKDLVQEKIKFDAVFWDAFSPKVNTEMWTVDLFKLVKEIMKEHAVFATYSASLAVRKGLTEAGFKIGLVEPIGRKSYSTVATIKGNITPLTEKEKRRLLSSPYAVSYKDNKNLDMDREEIKANWEKEVKSRL